MTRTDTPNSYTVGLTTAAVGPKGYYLVENLPTGELRQENTFCTGLKAVIQKDINGTLTSTLPNGMTSTLVTAQTHASGCLRRCASPWTLPRLVVNSSTSRPTALSRWPTRAL